MVIHAGSLLFSATLKDAVGLKAVLDLVDKDFSQEAGKIEQQGPSTTCASAAAICSLRLKHPLA